MKPPFASGGAVLVAFSILGVVVLAAFGSSMQSAVKAPTGAVEACECDRTFGACDDGCACDPDCGIVDDSTICCLLDPRMGPRFLPKSACKPQRGGDAFTPSLLQDEDCETVCCREINVGATETYVTYAEVSRYRCRNGGQERPAEDCEPACCKINANIFWTGYAIAAGGCKENGGEILPLHKAACDKAAVKDVCCAWKQDTGMGPLNLQGWIPIRDCLLQHGSILALSKEECLK